MSRKTLNLPTVVAFVALQATAGLASPAIDWDVICSGGGSGSSPSYSLSATYGQPVAGVGFGTDTLHWVGFRSGQALIPASVASPFELKNLSDDQYVRLPNVACSTAAGDFSSFVYVQSIRRSSGVRVALPAEAQTGLSRGTVVSVTGTMGTTPEGERQVVGPLVAPGYTSTPPCPLFLAGSAVGGADLGVPPAYQPGVLLGLGLNNVGLLVRVCGRLQPGSGYFEVDDGSGPVRVDISRLTSVPDTAGYVAVTGICTLYKPDSRRKREIMPRDDSDVSVVQ